MSSYISNDLPLSLSESGSYLNADNTCIFYQDKDVEDKSKTEDVLNKKNSHMAPATMKTLKKANATVKFLYTQNT